MAELLAFSQSIPPDVSFRHIQDFVYFVGDREKGEFFRGFKKKKYSVYYGTVDPSHTLGTTASKFC